MSNGGAATIRNIFNSDDRSAFHHVVTYSLPASKDHIYIGADPTLAELKTVDLVHVFANEGVAIGVGAPALSIDTTAVESALPIVGSVTPYGVHGEAPAFDMADANYTTSTEHRYSILVSGAATPQTADRTLFLPDSTALTGAPNGGAYSKFIRNMNGGGFDLIVQNLYAGTTVAIPDGSSAWVGIHAGGAFRMSPNIPN